MGTHNSSQRQEAINSKYKLNGKLEKYKARVVTKRYNQLANIYYHDSFSPIVNNYSLSPAHTSIRH